MDGGRRRRVTLDDDPRVDDAVAERAAAAAAGAGGAELVVVERRRRGAHQRRKQRRERVDGHLHLIRRARGRAQRRRAAVRHGAQTAHRAVALAGDRRRPLAAASHAGRRGLREAPAAATCAGLGRTVGGRRRARDADGRGRRATESAAAAAAAAMTPVCWRRRRRQPRIGAYQTARPRQLRSLYVTSQLTGPSRRPTRQRTSPTDPVCRRTPAGHRRLGRRCFRSARVRQASFDIGCDERLTAGARLACDVGGLVGRRAAAVAGVGSGGRLSPRPSEQRQTVAAEQLQQQFHIARRYRTPLARRHVS